MQNQISGVKPDPNPDLQHFVREIGASGKSIYDELPVGSELRIPAAKMERILDQSLGGESLVGLPLRTRSKVVKQKICRALGYPVPESFRRTQPRFPGQQFDVYVQKSLNLQIWNEELTADRRYVIVGVSDDDLITAVRVITGSDLAKLDSTNTLTQKYQARGDVAQCELVSDSDTENVLPLINDDADLSKVDSPSSEPEANKLLSIEKIYNLTGPLIEQTFPDVGADGERNRGAKVHAMVCRALGYGKYHDDGRYPDVRHQLLEVKLQTSPTIDLGLVRPDSDSPLDAPRVGGRRILHRDVRYAVFFADTDGGTVRIKHVVLTTGKDFFGRFPQFQGKVVNRKNQIALPKDFFDESR